MKSKVVRIEKFDSNNKLYLNKALEIRKKVFVEEQGVDPILEYENDDNSTHFLLFKDNLPLACARYRFTDKGIKLERFAVLKENRGMNFGAILLKFMLNDLCLFDVNVYLHAQIQVVKFYERFDFKAVGCTFYEAGIEHLEMKYISNIE